jgi:hypothetical protein
MKVRHPIPSAWQALPGQFCKELAFYKEIDKGVVVVIIEDDYANVNWSPGITFMVARKASLELFEENSTFQIRSDFRIIILSK